MLLSQNKICLNFAMRKSCLSIWQFVGPGSGTLTVTFSTLFICNLSKLTLQLLYVLCLCILYLSPTPCRMSIMPAIPAYSTYTLPCTVCAYLSPTRVGCLSCRLYRRTLHILPCTVCAHLTCRMSIMPAIPAYSTYTAMYCLCIPESHTV